MSIDNNVSERSVRAQAIGRKNYLLVGSGRGGRTAATLYSLVGSYKLHHIDPFAYLKDVLESLATHPADRLGELLADAWLASHLHARLKVDRWSSVVVRYTGSPSVGRAEGYQTWSSAA